MADLVLSSPDDVLEAARRLSQKAPELRERPVRTLIEALGTVGERFLDPTDPLRVEALDRLPDSAHLSPEMARAVLDGMAVDWTKTRLRTLVEREFEEPDVLDGLVETGARVSRAVGGSLTTQIVSGSVPGVGVNALLRSLLVKSPTLLKAGAGDTLLPMLFARALREADPELSDALAVVYWPGSSETGQMASALRHAEVVVVYGSDDTVRKVRSLSPPTVRVVSYRHREALALVARGALGATGTTTDTAVESAGKIASQVARAVAMFDQRGCVCPHLVLVEEGGVVPPERFARLLAEGLAELESTLPAARLGVDEAAALQQLRGVSELQGAGHGGFVISGGGAATWTVIFEPNAVEGPVTLGRGVRVRPIENLSGLEEAVTSMIPHMQSVGIAGAGPRFTEIADAVGLLGASRITPIERLAFPPAWWLHDGRGPLRELVRWVEVEPG